MLVGFAGFLIVKLGTYFIRWFIETSFVNTWDTLVFNINLKQNHLYLTSYIQSTAIKNLVLAIKNCLFVTIDRTVYSN